MTLFIALFSASSIADSSFSEGVSADSLAAEKLSALNEKIHQAIVKFEQTDRKRWSYQVVRFENEEGDITSSLERFTPTPDAKTPWMLLRINGSKPTTKQQKKFLKTKRKNSDKKQKGKNYSVKFREIINVESLAYQAETATHLKMTFQVQLNQFGDDAKGKLDGLLSYNKQKAFIETITITNNAAFSPMFSASINEFLLTFNFINIDEAILFREHTLEMKGTFAYFVEIDEVSKDTYFDHQYQALVE
jgi:hypothetical protein